MRLDGIKTVLLDIDGTVMDFLRGQRNAFYHACLINGIEFSDELYVNFDTTNKKLWKMFEIGKIKKDVLVYQRFSELFSAFDINADPISFEHTYQKELGEQCFFIDGALDGIKYLSKKYEIFVATNGVKATQLNRLRKSGLCEYVKKVFISEEIGFQKPQKEYFDKALEDTDRSAAVIIGDSMTGDIKGGIDAGIKTIWFNPDNEIKTFEPTAEVRSWAEICEIL